MTAKRIWMIATALLLAACGSGNNRHAYEALKTSDTESVTEAVSDTASAVTQQERKVIRTADFKCKVASVFTATTQLEHMVQSLGGTVQQSHMDNNHDDVTTINYKTDSLKEIHSYTTTAMLTLSVPTLLLDSVINMIPNIVSYIDSRTISQQDVTLQYMANKLKRDAINKTDMTGQGLKLAKKSTDPINVQQYAEAQEEKR